MKVLIVIPYLASVYGGTSKVVKDIARAISNLSVEVDLIATDANGCDKLDVPLETWVQENNYKVRYFPCIHKYDLIFSLSLLNWLCQNINKYDLIHIHTVFSPLVLVVYWICQFYRVPYIVTPHGMLEPWALSHKAWKKKIYFNFLEKPALQQASTVHFVASSEANSAKDFGLNRVAVIPNGVNWEELERLPHPDIFYDRFPQTKNKTSILFLGRIDPKKGLDLLATAFAIAHRQFPETHLIVAGPDSIGFLPTAQRYFTESGCLNAVTFTGMLAGSCKLAALAATDIYVAPSYSEGFSISVLEGMGSGLPCVITTGCNFPEAEIAQAAYVVRIDAKVIADALIKCLTNPQQAKAMGDRSREFISQNYTWQQSAVKLLEIYQKIIERKTL
jgi:glycosyltransferase involved in cell wall biosynthesis